MTAGLALGWVLIAGPGCARGYVWTGTWEGRREVVAPETAPSEIQATIERIRVTIREDATFEVVEAGIPRTGNASLSPRRASLQVKEVFGKAVKDRGEGAVAMNQPLVLTLQPDGTAHFTDPGGFHPEPVVLTKRPQPDEGLERN